MMASAKLTHAVIPNQVQSPEELEFWEVVHTRTSHFESSIPLEEMASRLVSSGACAIVFSNSGKYWHIKDGSLRVDAVTLNARPRAQHGTVKFEHPEEEFAGTCLLLACELAFIEHQTYSEEVIENLHYVRCFFDPFYVEEQGRHIGFYPVAKIYDNGVCVFSLRIFSGDVQKSLDELADGVLDIGSKYFDNLLIPSSIFENVPLQDLISAFVELNHAEFSKLTPEQVSKAILGQEFCLDDSDDAPIYRRTQLEAASGYAMLETVWAMLDGLLDDLAFRPVKLNYRALKLRRSAYPRPWFGHPIVFMLKWKGQPQRASEIGGLENTVARLVAGSREVVPEALSILVQPMPRVYDDYLFFMTEGSSVYLMSGNCLDRAQPEDTHFQRVSLPMIANEELALWLVGSYRSVASRAKNARSAKALNSLRRQLSLLESLRIRLSHYGELELMFSSYLDRCGAIRAQKAAETSLDQLDRELRERTNLRIAAFGLVASILFGLVGSGQIADSIFAPLRKAGIKFPVLFGLPIPVSDLLVSALLVLLVCMVGWVAVLRRTSK